MKKIKPLLVSAVLLIFCTIFVFAKYFHQHVPETHTTNNVQTSNVEKSVSQKIDIGNDEKNIQALPKINLNTTKIKKNLPVEEQFQEAKNLYKFISDIRESENNGNPHYQALEALALSECAPLSASPAFLYGLNNSLARHIPEYILSDYSNRCKTLASSQKINAAAIDSLYKSAESGGDTYARARRFASDWKDLSPSDASRQMLEIVESGDPYAVSELSSVFADPTSQRLSEYAGSDIASFAWQLVACDLGMDCSARSYVVRQMCLFGGICYAGDFRTVLSQVVLSPKDFYQTEQMEASIVEAINSGYNNKLVN